MPKRSKAEHRVTSLALMLCLLTVTLTLARQSPVVPEQHYLISGQVVDPHKLRPEDAVLMLVRRDGDGSSSIPISVDADGTFVTPRVSRGTYLLKIVRTPHSATRPAAQVGFRAVTVDHSDVSDIVVAVRRDFAITGTFRMESDNPKAEWPTHIVVNAFVALNGVDILDSSVAEGAPGGRFVLRNAFGPRVLRCGYTLAPGHRWWPSRVMLDGTDITNVPTDFSRHENSRLEVIFTQHPARITGTVMNAEGVGVRAPWILVLAHDRSLWHNWASTSHVAQGDTKGSFSLAVQPGTYLVRAVPQTMFDSWSHARRQIPRYAHDGVTVTVRDREVKAMTLSMRAP